MSGRRQCAVQMFRAIERQRASAPVHRGWRGSKAKTRGILSLTGHETVFLGATAVGRRTRGGTWEKVSRGKLWCGTSSRLYFRALHRADIGASWHEIWSRFRPAGWRFNQPTRLEKSQEKEANRQTLCRAIVRQYDEIHASGPTEIGFGEGCRWKKSAPWLAEGRRGTKWARETRQTRFLGLHTRWMESMIENSRPTRAEGVDVAQRRSFDGDDAVIAFGAAHGGGGKPKRRWGQGTPLRGRSKRWPGSSAHGRGELRRPRQRAWCAQRAAHNKKTCRHLVCGPADIGERLEGPRRWWRSPKSGDHRQTACPASHSGLPPRQRVASPARFNRRAEVRSMGWPTDLGTEEAFIRCRTCKSTDEMTNQVR